MNPVTDEIANKYSTVIKGTHSNFTKTIKYEF